MMKKRILITGAAGGVGSHVIAELADQAEIVGFDAIRGRSEEVDWRTGDITDVDAVTDAAQGCDAVIHLAGIPIYSEDKRVDIGRVNVFGTQIVLEAVARAQVPLFTQASSICATGFIFGSRKPEPAYFPLDEDSTGVLDDIYSMGKAIDEQLAFGYARRFGFSVTNLRMATVWAPNHALTDELHSDLLLPSFDNNLEYCDLRWQYVDTRDVAQAFRLAVETATPSAEAKVATYNIGAADSPGGDWRVWVNDLYPEVPVLKEAMRMVNDPTRPLWAIDKARAELSFSPRHSWQEYPIFVKQLGAYLERRAA